MKKIILLFVSALSVFSYAQKAQLNESVAARMDINVPAKHAELKTTAIKTIVPAVTPEMLTTVKKADATPMTLREAALKPAKARAAETEDFYAMYSRPEGTFFCGIDPEGTYLWINFPSLVGAWKNGLTEWTYKNYSEGAESVEWKSRLYPRYSQYFSITEEGDFVDSLIQEFPRDGYPELPALIASKTVDSKQVKDSFVLMGYPGEPVDTTIANTLVWNGYLNPISDDGMFPLTNAMFFNRETGLDYSMSNVWDTDEDTKSWSYIYGTKPLTYQGEEGDVTFQPARLFVSYDKPQAPLFVKEITIALQAIIFNEDSAKFCNDTATFSQLGVAIMSADASRMLASATCTIKDTTNNMYIPGCMAHFSFQQKDEYDMVISEGITINEPFVVMLTGLDQEGANFGILSSLNPYFSANTLVMDTDGKIHGYANFDPYIMLNGVFYTLEDNSKDFFGLVNYGDTINMVANYDESGVYYLTHADGDLKGYSNVAIAATEMLYDTTTYHYNYNITAPDWANIIEMEWIDGDIDTWYNLNSYQLFIEGVEEYFEPGTELPKVGDEIKLSKYGRELVFKIVDVDGPQGIESVSGNNKVQTKKFIREGHLIIERNGVKYSATGAKL
jgi:hypothetical protein